MSILQKITPINTDQERKKFLFDPNYNPQFVYESPITQKDLLRFGEVSSEYLDTAMKIMKKVIDKWGTESNYLREMEGELMEKKDVSQKIHEYLEMHGLERKVRVYFTQKAIARTLVDGTDLYIRIPFDYRQDGFIGVLDHEVGTHILRRINDRIQPWSEKREQYALRPHLETEEGLASLHSHVSTPNKLMWLRAVHYYAAYQASKMSFAQLNQDLKKYIDDKERRFKVCLRVKRGISDTSIPGAFSKDQIYLRGTIKVLQWLKDNDFQLEHVYLGKLAVEDIERIRQLPHEANSVLPHFYTRDKKAYKQQILEIKKANEL